MKKIKIVTLLVTLLFVFNTVAYAAVSSSGSRMRSSSPAKTPQIHQTAPSNSQSGYKPSAPASSYSDKAAADSVKPGTNYNPQSQPTTGGFWRNAAMFGSGMLLGGLLGNMFGFNWGPMSPILELMLNVLFLIAVIAAIRFAWNKLRNADERRRY